MSNISKKHDKIREIITRLPPSEVDPHSAVHGVLLSDEIIYYATAHQMIVPFNREQLKPAGYELAVGDEYFLSGEFHVLDTTTSKVATITIPPFEVAVLKTAEIICLPRYMIARWNIRVRHAYSGLLWVGGPQVDPGFVGHLFCPIYNLSDKPVTLRLGERLALMDFAKTTPFDERKPQSELIKYLWPPPRTIIEDYDIGDFRSALYTRAGQKISEFEESLKQIEWRFVTFTQISFGLFALMIALVSVASKAGAENVVLGASVWGPISVGISMAALLIAIFSYIQLRVARLVLERYGTLVAETARNAQKFIRRSWLRAVSLSVMIAIAGGIGTFFLSKPFFRELRQQRVITKSDLEGFQASMSLKIQEAMGRVDAVERRGPDQVEALRRELAVKIDELRTSINAQQQPK